MKYLALITCLICVGCATKPPPGGSAIAPPPKAKPIAPTAEKVRTQIGVVREHSVLVNEGLSKALHKVDILMAQKAANEKDLKDLWAILTDEKARVAALWTQLEATNNVVDELNAEALAKDVEVKTLRQSLDEANARIDKAKEWEKMAAPKVAVYDEWDKRLTQMKWGFIIILILAGVGLFLIYVLPAILRIFKPPMT